ncbi:hypothetical protein LP417_23595 [Polaromonas sp. P1-6]|nr:hypothetical protein LP417_23595 [Polaromonas sp. P1-6]
MSPISRVIGYHPLQAIASAPFLLPIDFLGRVRMKHQATPDCRTVKQGLNRWIVAGFGVQQVVLLLSEEPRICQRLTARSRVLDCALHICTICCFSCTNCAILCS